MFVDKKHSTVHSTLLINQLQFIVFYIPPVEPKFTFMYVGTFCRNWINDICTTDHLNYTLVVCTANDWERWLTVKELKEYLMSTYVHFL